MPTKKYDIYNYVYKINQAINDVYNMESFDIIRFINDEDYALHWIDQIEEQRVNKRLAYNPLAVLNGLPHVKNM